MRDRPRLIEVARHYPTFTAYVTCVCLLAAIVGRL